MFSKKYYWLAIHHRLFLFTFYTLFQMVTVTLCYWLKHFVRPVDQKPKTQKIYFSPKYLNNKYCFTSVLVCLCVFTGIDANASWERRREVIWFSNFMLQEKFCFCSCFDRISRVCPQTISSHFLLLSYLVLRPFNHQQRKSYNQSYL